MDSIVKRNIDLLMSIKGKWGVVLCNGGSIGSFLNRMCLGTSFTHCGFLFPEKDTGEAMIFDVAFRPFSKDPGKRQDGWKIQTLANFKKHYEGTYKTYVLDSVSPECEKKMRTKIKSLCRLVQKYSRNPLRGFASYFFEGAKLSGEPRPGIDSSHMFCSKGVALILQAGGYMSNKIDVDYVIPLETVTFVKELKLLK